MTRTHRACLFGRSLWSAMGLALCLLMCKPVSAADEQAPPTTRKVMFIGIDGCRFDAIQAADTPNLDKLMSQGCFTDRCLILGDRYQGNDTISGPGWSSILCGVWADKHGVQDNSFKGRNYDEYPHCFRRLKEIDPKAYTASLVTWVPIQQYIVSSADVGVMFAPLNGDYIKADAQATKGAVKILAERDPTIVFLYIGQVDETGHAHGFTPR